MSYGSRPASTRKDTDTVVGDGVPVDEVLLGSRVEEHESGAVDRPDVVIELRRVERLAELVGSQDVEPLVLDEGGHAHEGVEDPLDYGTHTLLARPPPASPVRCGVGGAGEVEEVHPVGLVELQRSGDPVEDVLGDAPHVAAFQSHVVLGADAGEHGDLLAAKPLDPPVAAVGGQAGLLRGDPRPP